MDTITQDSLLQHIDPPNHTFISAEKALEQMERAHAKDLQRSDNEPGMPNAVPIGLLRRLANESDAAARFRALGYPVHVRKISVIQSLSAEFPQRMDKLADGWYFMWPRSGNGTVYEVQG